MMHATRDPLPMLFAAGAAGIHAVDWGDQRAAFISIPAGVDIPPLLKGLPGDRCSCPRWGFVLNGRMLVTYPDREETFQSGELFYMPPRYVVNVEQAVEYVEFSPHAAYDAFLEVAKRNVGAAKAP